MQYLTPELLTRYRSRDEKVADAAAEEWEQALAAYNGVVEAIRESLPSGARTLLDRWSLHDARLLGIVVARRSPRLSLLIQLEGKPDCPGQMLELRYLVARGARHPGYSLTVHPKIKKTSKDRGRIHYDEFRKVTEDPVSVFSHSLLLRGGTEVEITFTDMQVRRLQRVILPAVEQVVPC